MNKLRRYRKGFALAEPFVVAFVLLLAGLGITFAIRSFAGVHWTAWIPSILFALPFMFFFGVIPAKMLFDYLKKQKKDL